MGSELISKTVRNPLRAALFAGATALALAAAGGVAQASVMYSLTNSNVTGATGPFGTVTLTDGTAANGTGYVEVQELLGSNSTANTGAASAQFEFNLGSGLTNITASSINFFDVTSGTPTTSKGQLVSGPKHPNNNTVGSFGYGISCTSCKSGASAPQYHKLTFDLTATNGLTTSNFTKNGANIYFLADIYDSNFNTNGNTGYVWTVTQSVPEPGSLALLGTGLLGVGFAVQRRRRRT